MRAYQQIGMVFLASLLLSVAMIVAMDHPVGQLYAATVTERSTQSIGKKQDAITAVNMIPNLETLVDESDLIVRARVTVAECKWNDAHTKIRTDSVLDILYPIAGTLPSQPVKVITDGGYIEDEDIGMVTSHVNWLNDGDEVLLFLKEEGDQYEITELMEGHFRIENDEVINSDTLVQMPITDFLAHVQVELFNQNITATLPENWQSLETFPPPPTGPSSIQSTQNRAFQFKNRQWVGADDSTEVRYKVNINSAQAGGDDGSAKEFLDAIINAAEVWNNVATAGFTLIYDGPTPSTSVGFNGANEVLFMPKGEDNATGLAEFWFVGSGSIIEADIWLNEDHLFNATGSPDANEVDLHSVAMHEFGHWLALGHDDSETEAIMYAFLQGGTLKRSLHQNDMDGISFIYPCEDEPCAEVADTPAETNTPTASPTSAPTSTATVAPTDTPTDVPTDVPTVAPTATSTPTTLLVTATHTPTPLSAAPTSTPTSTLTDTPTDIPASPNIGADTPTATSIPTAEDLPVVTETPTSTEAVAPTDTAIPTEVVAPTEAIAPTETETPTPEPTSANTPTPTSGPTDDPSVPPNSGQQVEISLGVSQTLQCTNDGDEVQITLQIPSNAVIRTTTLSCSVSNIPSEPFADYAMIGSGLIIDAYQDGERISPFNFIMPIEVVAHYTDEAILGNSEETLALYTWNETEGLWESASCQDVTHDQGENSVTIPICHLTQFALFAEEIPSITAPFNESLNESSGVYLPLVIR